MVNLTPPTNPGRGKQQHRIKPIESHRQSSETLLILAGDLATVNLDVEMGQCSLF